MNTERVFKIRGLVFLMEDFKHSFIIPGRVVKRLIFNLMTFEDEVLHVEIVHDVYVLLVVF